MITKINFFPPFRLDKKDAAHILDHKFSDSDWRDFLLFVQEQNKPEEMLKQWFDKWHKLNQKKNN
jgi:hypothetical protein